MANKDQNDKELNDYLKGDSDLSKAYRASNKVEPSVHLDEKILSAAKDTINSDKQKTKFHKAPWVKPVSIAAIVTLSVSLVVTMQQETGQSIISEPEVEMYDSAAVIEEISLPESKQSSDDETVINEIELKQKKDARVDAAVPAALGAATDLYRTEEKAELERARMKQAPAKRMLMKEKEQMQADALEERVFADEVMPSAPTGIEFDSVMDMEQEKQQISTISEVLSIDDLLKESSKYDGEEVVVKGVLHFEFEGNELRSGSYKLAVSLAESVRKNTEAYSNYKNKYNGTLVKVKGIFNLEFKGHRGMWPAGITDVTSIIPYNNKVN
ncbi:MAG: hypothetical protein HND53_01735 [Proteobacteria bacterium]|nr:hypothetical protein [Pseudomonadota bacterium]NOG59191.1 hypothetical protein [Pseudomonadota bacterium]